MNPAPGFKEYPQHRVETRPSSAHVRVSYKGELIADTREAVELHEAVRMERLERLAFYPDKFEISTPATGGK